MTENEKITDPQREMVTPPEVPIVCRSYCGHNRYASN